MITLNITSYRDATGAYPSVPTSLTRLFSAVSVELSNLISGPNAAIDFETSVETAGYASAGSYYAATGGISKGLVATEVQTGVDGNGTAADAVLRLSKELLDGAVIWATNPADARAQLAYNAVVHEVFHALGIQGFRDKATGALSPSVVTPFDTMVIIEDGKPYFTGRLATAVNGGKVALTPLGGPSSIYHIDSATDRMAPGAPNGGTLSGLDLAILRDLGFGVTQSVASADGRSIVAGAGTQTITGTAGIDTVHLVGNRADYVQGRPGGLSTFTKVGDATTKDTLVGVERVMFADSAIAFDADGVAGQAYRLYQAAFNRKPDLGGLGFWINQMDNGMSLNGVADSFIRSDEFKLTYGANLTNDKFLTLLYNNVLHRNPDPEGFKHWTNVLNSGASRSSVLAGFSESAENKAQIILSSEGHSAQAYRLYQAAFDRTPDLGGLVYWTQLMDQGLKLNDVAYNFIASTEFGLKYGISPSNAQFVTSLYSNVLNRSPDSEGYNHWMTALSSGVTREQVLIQFSESAENRAQLVGVIQDGFQYTPA